MQAKTVGCWRYGYWTKLTLFYEPLPKGGIPPEQHPAVQEDEWLAEPVEAKWKKGELAKRIENYLGMNGPQIISVIALDLDCTIGQIDGVLKRNPQKFYVTGYRIIRLSTGGATKAGIWGLVEVTN